MAPIILPTIGQRCSCDWERYSCPSPCSLLANHAESIQLGITQTDSCTRMVDDFWAKMSKSTGETVSPLALAEQYGADAFRFFVMREMTVGQDAEFSLERFSSRYKGELGNDFGNLVSRLLHMCHQYFEGIAPEPQLNEELEKKLQTRWEEVSAKTLDLYQTYHFHQALEETIGFVRAINKYADERAPWKLAKSDAPEDKKALATSLATMLEGLRLANELLAPELCPVPMLKFATACAKNLPKPGQAGWCGASV